MFGVVFTEHIADAFYRTLQNLRVAVAQNGLKLGLQGVAHKPLTVELGPEALRIHMYGTCNRPETLNAYLLDEHAAVENVHMR